MRGGLPIILVAAASMAASCTSLPVAPTHVTVPAESSSIAPAENRSGAMIGSVYFATIHEAAAAVQSGSTVEILPGIYDDCAVWPATASGLHIMAMGEVVVSGKSCDNKGLFVIQGNDVTVQGITFRGATSTRYNGAGIRAEGTNLTVEDSRFFDNQDGILAGIGAQGALIVRGSLFQGNGACIAECAHGIYAGHIARLHVEDCRFLAQTVGHHVKSRALRTEIIDNVIEDGPAGTSSYLIDVPEGGAVFISGNRLEKGPHTSNPTTAIAIGAEGKTRGFLDTPSIDIERNSFVSDMLQPVDFVRNYTPMPAVLRDNRLTGRIVPLEGKGSVETKVSAKY